MAARLTTEKKAAVVGALVEGASIRATERMTSISRPTIDKLISRMGRASDRLMRQHVRGFRPAELQMDELWAFVGKKRNHVGRGDDPSQVGDFWTWVALDPESKLVPHTHVGKRTERDAVDFCLELANRVEGRIQISTDKLAAYRWAIGLAFGDRTDYGRIVKRYQVPVDRSEGRYSPPVCVGVEKDILWGDPDPARISTSHVERQNLTVRMQSRRFTRLTNGFSKKVENLRAAVALHFAHYNFVRRHGTIKTAPAVAAGLAEKPWTLADLVEWGDLHGR